MFFSFTMEFEWNERKNKINIQKHGIDFKEAVNIFLDEKLIDHFDSNHSTFFEERYEAIGFYDAHVTVFYTERHGKIRIISARFSTKEEIDEYYRQNDIR